MTIPECQQPFFQKETDAYQYLEEMLLPWFRLQRQVRLRHLIAKNEFIMDYLATPEPWTEFPFDLFGIEVKRSVSGIGEFNKAIKQSIDYTFCEIIDKHDRLDGVRGCRVERVYVFPAPVDEGRYAADWHGGSERLAGLFHVGLIYVRRSGAPHFSMSAERQWDSDNGARATPIHIHKRLGSGGIERRLTERSA